MGGVRPMPRGHRPLIRCSTAQGHHSLLTQYKALSYGLSFSVGNGGCLTDGVTVYGFVGVKGGSDQSQELVDSPVNGSFTNSHCNGHAPKGVVHRLEFGVCTRHGVWVGKRGSEASCLPVPSNMVLKPSNPSLDGASGALSHLFRGGSQDQEVGGLLGVIKEGLDHDLPLLPPPFNHLLLRR